MTIDDLVDEARLAAVRQLRQVVERLTSERDEAVRVAGELRAKAAPLIEYLRKGHMPPQAGCTACAMLAEWDSLTASTGGSSDEPQKEIRE